MFQHIRSSLTSLMTRRRRGRLGQEAPIETRSERDSAQAQSSIRLAEACAPKTVSPATQIGSANWNEVPENEKPLDLNRRFEWPSQLKPYQIEGVHTLLSNDRLLLADDMGLGKTVQAIAAIRILTSTGALQHSLLIVPASLVSQWRREIAHWAPELSVMTIKGPSVERTWQWNALVNVTLVSYETFRSDFGYSSSNRLGGLWDLVIIDEAQKIKNRDSEISRKIKRLRRSRSWALTGTPVENRLDDIASILEFVDHNSGGASQPYSANAIMLKRHKQLQLRRRKSDVLSELPPKQLNTLSIELHPRQMAAYRRAESDGIVQLQANGSTIRVTHVLEHIIRLKQLCNVDPVSGESAKLTDIRERMRVLTDEGHRALVFTQFVNHFGVEAAASWLSAFTPLTFTGALNSSERDLVVRKFKEEDRHKALILSLRAGGVGLNLQEASYVFHLDRWWNPAVEKQAEDRAHRLGQLFPVTVYQYICADTIEERIDRLIAEKQLLFDDLVDDVSLDLASALTHRELFGLFGLESPPARRDSRTITTSDLAARCSEFLRAHGWEVVGTTVRRGRFDVLVSRKIDLIGILQSLQIWCIDIAGAVQADDIQFVLANLPDKTFQVVVASPAGFSSAAETLATNAGLRMWNEKTIARFDRTSEN